MGDHRQLGHRAPTAALAAAACLADSPVGDYANSRDSYALTAVNLTWDDVAGAAVLGPACG